MIRAGRNWIRSIRITLTLLGFPHSNCLTETSFVQLPLADRVKSITTSAVSLCVPSLGRDMSQTPHKNARCPFYPGSQICRFPVPDDKVDWETAWSQYHPLTYTAPAVLKKPVWADPEVGCFSPKFNSLDGAVNRKSHEGEYKIEQGMPLNPRGRTGLNGRGLLGRWGPNHAADPIVTRWKTDPNGERISHPRSKLPVLQFVSIRRIDCGEWAIPGGMVDPGELVSLTLQREFSEEALNSLEAVPEDRVRIHQCIGKLFSSPGLEVYKGYVDDPRNTDNSWMETIAVNFHDETGNSVSELPLQAGDDAGQVQWIDIDSALSLYAIHSHFLEVVAKERHAHW